MKSVQKLKLEELNRIDVDGYKKAQKIPVVIVLDNFRSALNVGSIFRTSDAFLVEKVFLCGITATPPNKEILKTAIGANLSVEWEHFSDIRTVIGLKKEEGYTIVGIEQTNKSEPLNEYSISQDEKYCIVLGNEVEGLSNSILDEVDDYIEIPQFGTKHSLNVSVCAGIIIHHFAQKFL